MRGREEANRVNTFLNPESMLTPGLAGALVMAVTNALAVNFGFDGSERAYAGLILSFVVGLLVFVAERRLWLRAVYYLLNSCVIFAVAFGTNSIGSNERIAWVPITSPAFAQQAGSPQPSTCKYLQDSLLDAQRRHDTAAAADLEKIIAKNCNQAVPAKNATTKFFAPWK